jgi:hypothetical protein
VAYIFIGSGAGACVLSLDKVPDSGDKLTIQPSMVYWENVRDLGHAMCGNRYEFTRLPDDVNFSELGILPHFSIQRT